MCGSPFKVAPGASDSVAQECVSLLILLYGKGRWGRRSDGVGEGELSKLNYHARKKHVRHAISMLSGAFRQQVLCFMVVARLQLKLRREYEI